MYKVLITNTVPANTLEPLTSIATVIQGPDNGDLTPRAEILRLAPELDAIINQAELVVDEELLQLAPRLKIVANVAMGANNLNCDLMARYGVWATNTPGVFADSTADCTLGMVINLARQLVTADRYVRSGSWVQDGFQPGVWDGIGLRGKVLGIVGFGHIGRSVAERARAFGMSIIFNDPKGADHSEYRSIDDLMQEADFVSLHVPLTPSTHHLINARRFELMKPHAFLINMARGPVVHEKALVAALRSNRIAGAALDVFEFEPDVHHDLLQMDNVCLTPHLGGATRESRYQARRLAAENVAAVLRGDEPLTPLNRPPRSGS